MKILAKILLVLTVTFNFSHAYANENTPEVTLNNFYQLLNKRILSQTEWLDFLGHNNTRSFFIYQRFEKLTTAAIIDQSGQDIAFIFPDNKLYPCLVKTIQQAGHKIGLNDTKSFEKTCHCDKKQYIINLTFEDNHNLRLTILIRGELIADFGHPETSVWYRFAINNNQLKLYEISAAG